MTPRDALRVFILQNVGDDRLILQRVLQALHRGELSFEQVADCLKFAFRLTYFVTFFQYLAAFLMVGKGRSEGLEDIRPNAPQVAALYPLFSVWLRQALVEGRLSLPPVNETSGMAFVSTIFDDTEGLLLSVRANDEARRLGELRRLVEETWRKAGGHWVLSTAYCSHVGHFVHTSTLLTLQRSGDLPNQPIVMLRGRSDNAYLASRFAQYMVDVAPQPGGYVEMMSGRKLHSLTRGGTAASIELASRATRIWADGPAFLDPDSDLERRGAAMLSELGVGPNDPVVTIHVREAGYNASIAAVSQLRDSDFHTYTSAIRELTERGFTVIRLGDRSMKPAPAIAGLIDYPFTEAKCDWMDIYLAGRCAFHIGTSSGMSFIPLMFGRPVLFTNFPTLVQIIAAPSVVALPKVLQRRSGEAVPFEEYCRCHRDVLEVNDTLLHDLRFVDNDPDDLTEAARMMADHLDPVTGRLEVPARHFARARALLPLQPQIPDWFVERHEPAEIR